MLQGQPLRHGTVEGVLKDCLSGHTYMVSQDRWSIGDRLNRTEMCDFFPGICGP